MIRNLLLNVLLKVLYWVWEMSLHRGDDVLADKADALAREIARDLDKRT